MRYLKARPSRLVSSVSLLSITGIAVGVAALVVAMGLLSGYRTEIREKLIGANAPVVVFPAHSGRRPGSVRAREARRRACRACGPRRRSSTRPGVAASAATPDGVDAVLKGIDPAAERRVSELERLPAGPRARDHARRAGFAPGRRDRRGARREARRPGRRRDHALRRRTPRAGSDASLPGPAGSGSPGSSGPTSRSTTRSGSSSIARSSASSRGWRAAPTSSKCA